MTLARTLKHPNWNYFMSASIGRILTTGLKGQSIGKSPGEVLMPGNRLSINWFQEQMESANLHKQGEEKKQVEGTGRNSQKNMGPEKPVS